MPSSAFGRLTSTYKSIGLLAMESGATLVCGMARRLRPEERAARRLEPGRLGYIVELFDHSLVEAGRKLIENPADAEAKVEFVTTYHMVIEGTLALTGQHFITSYWEDNDLLPGFVDGFKKVARDEHRHVAYGTWFLKQACESDPKLADAMRAKLMELLPIASTVLVPQGVDPNEEWEMVGYKSTEINEFAFNALNRRLKAIGVPLSTEAVPA